MKRTNWSPAKLGRFMGVYLQVLNSASQNGLSFDTRGRLNDAVTPSRSIVTFIVAPFIGLALSA